MRTSARVPTHIGHHGDNASPVRHGVVDIDAPVNVVALGIDAASPLGSGEISWKAVRSRVSGAPEKGASPRVATPRHGAGQDAAGQRRPAAPRRSQLRTCILAVDAIRTYHLLAGNTPGAKSLWRRLLAAIKYVSGSAVDATERTVTRVQGRIGCG